MNPLGMEYLTLYGAHPLDYVRTCARVGCAQVSFFTRSLDFEGLPPGPPSLFDDAQLRKDVISLVRDNGLTIGCIDGFGFHGDVSVRDHRPLLDVLGELGVTLINTTSNVEWGRTVDEISALVELATSYGLTVTAEAVATFSLGTLPKALELAAKVDRKNFKLTIDTMHVSRTGGAPLVGTMDPDLIGYVQICDGWISTPTIPGPYLQEALHERMVPGEGDYPLVEMMKSVPPGVIVSLEVPMRALRERGVSDVDRAAAAAAGTRKVMQAASEARTAK
jgi:sugar phosphate isomerase/epimerase